MDASIDASVVNPPNSTPVTDDSVDPSNCALDSDYSTWLLVSHRRGLPRNHGGGARTPAMVQGSAAVPRNENRMDRGSTVYGIRGSLRRGTSSRSLVSHATFYNTPCLDEIATITASDLAYPPDPSITLPTISRDSVLSPSNVSRDSVQRFSNDPRDPAPPANLSHPVPSPFPPEMHSTLNPPPLLHPKGN